VFDYLLGGRHNFAADRRAAAIVLEPLPELRRLAQSTRDQLRRAVRYLVAEAGVRQLVDLGSGLPTTGNVHEIAHRLDPDVRVLYVDHDPMAITHARTLLTDETRTAAVLADIREPGAVLDHPVTRELIDLTQPVAVLASGILHHLDDTDAAGTVAGFVERLCPGSHLMINHLLDDDEPRAKEMERAFARGELGVCRFRTWTELGAYFDGLDLVDPGLVHADAWRPDELTPTDSPVRKLYAAGMGRMP
jgi:O-methyltransferase involved in polyketide biosynthesis